MHMVSEKDLNSAELETMRTSRSPTTVMTAKGEVRTNKEATVYVKQLDLFVTVMLLQETPAVLSLGKLCEEHGYTYHWKSGQNPHLSENGKRIDCKCQTTYHLWFLEYQRALPQLRLHLPRHHRLTEIQCRKTGVETPVSERSGSTSGELRGPVA